MGKQLIGQIGRDSMVIKARESTAKKDKTGLAKIKLKKSGCPIKDEVCPVPELGALKRQGSQILAKIVSEPDTALRHRYQKKCRAIGAL